MRPNFTNSMISPRALCLSLSKCANGFISPHRVCTINELHTTRFGWHRNCHSLHASSIKFKICIYLWSLPVFKLFSTRALASVHSQQLPHCKNKIHSMIKHLITYFGGERQNIPPSTTQIKNKSSLPQESPKRGIHLIFKNETEDLNECL